ncbi:adenosylmethionine--8-amino-7-oxononanoate transaminase [Robertkochia solimangrovi]|uniref:adenosylmethionine--8-amino-7-oxononanoate transaminase n=1 Tax=Robertkochia solimangrovi TaxID=2213046 RepID=UPI00117F4EE3|nr:adenosylmethionine--8-amino-7-oxononanoate transaminase [Robertkochia solimangrovi]TRZ45813.1 adenosylmethionine--8-amino-7-oxononanoate transaminase [Robertkochia solimangrovi]
MKLSERDKKHIWHPLTQHKTYPENLAIARAKGVYLYDESGKSYIDGISSWYTCMYGHCNPEITDRVAHIMQNLDQVVFSGFTHEPAVELSEKLIALLPDNQEKLFYSDNGSTSVEVGVKISLQYHFNKGDRKQVIIAFEEGFHGDTFGAMSVSNLSVYNGPFEGMLLEVIRIPVPNGNNTEELLSVLREICETKKVASFIYEPLVQGAAAMKMHDAESLNVILEYLHKQGVLLIADEVMTGFGKTGTAFASDQISQKPDIICMSKALTGGLLPMAATSCTQEVFDAFYSDDIAKGFFHGHTYTANPLSCTAALAAIELLQTEAIQSQIRQVIRYHEIFGEQVKRHPMVRGVRQCGVIFALDLDLDMSRYGGLRNKMFSYFMERGVYLRPLGNTIYIQAPYVIGQEEMNTIYEVILSLLEELPAMKMNQVE